METQITYYTDKINDNTLWGNADVFADTATGRNMKNRTESKKLLAKCRTGKVDLIRTKSISRFGRNTLDSIKVLRELRSRGVDVYFEQENIRILDPAAQHAIEIHCALAQNESENKSHNIKWGVQAGFEQGTSGYQHFACYGYRFDEIMQTLVIIPTEAEVVRLIFDLRLQGYSYGKISAELARQDIPSPTGSPFGAERAFVSCFVMRSVLEQRSSRKPMWRISSQSSRRKTWDSYRSIFTRITMRRLCRERFLRWGRKFNCWVCEYCASG